jgi:hypothetical protein
MMDRAVGSNMLRITVWKEDEKEVEGQQRMPMRVG